MKPLLKKVGLELIFKNKRPVSNLKFLAKLVEKCMLLQFNEHCRASMTVVPNVLLNYTGYQLGLGYNTRS